MEHLFFILYLATLILDAMIAYDIGKTVERRDNIRKQKKEDQERAKRIRELKRSRFRQHLEEILKATNSPYAEVLADEHYRTLLETAKEELENKL